MTSVTRYIVCHLIWILLRRLTLVPWKDIPFFRVIEQRIFSLQLIRNLWMRRWLSEGFEVIKRGPAIKQSEPFPCVPYTRFPKRCSRGVLSIVLTELCETSSVTTLVGSATHLNVCSLVFCVPVSAHVQMCVSLYSQHFNSKS